MFENKDGRLLKWIPSVRMIACRCFKVQKFTDTIPKNNIMTENASSRIEIPRYRSNNSNIRGNFCSNTKTCLHFDIRNYSLKRHPNIFAFYGTVMQNKQQRTSNEKRFLCKYSLLSSNIRWDELRRWTARVSHNGDIHHP